MESANTKSSDHIINQLTYNDKVGYTQKHINDFYNIAYIYIYIFMSFGTYSIFNHNLV